MLRLTRLSQQTIVINLEVVAWMESTPDTMVVLTNGVRIPVMESIEDVIDQAVAYRRRVGTPMVEPDGYDAVQRDGFDTVHGKE